MVNLRILRSPLSDEQNRTILSEYNRLTASQIPVKEFLRWVQGGPAGPAWHALLETDDSRIVGHTSLIPLRAVYRGKSIVPAKSEYSFIHEGFRSARIQGFEKSARPKFLILVDQLFRHCASLGWGPLLVSTTPAIHKLGPRVSCYPTEFPLRECLLILKPWAAARTTPNLGVWQRVVLFFVGVFHSVLFRLTAIGSGRQNAVRSVPVTFGVVRRASDRLAFFEDEASLEWRYLESQYNRFAIADDRLDYVIVKRGNESRYLRVCQWHITTDDLVAPFVKTIAREARAQNALGVRWAVYGNDDPALRLAGRLQRTGFLCASRVRTELIHSANPEFRTAAAWQMNDSLFSFDP